MSDEQQRHAQVGPPGWQPIPRGAEYDADGTAFLQLPPELLAHPGAALSGSGGWDPLAATGAGGYTPPTGESWQQPHAPVQAQPQWTEQWNAQASYEPPRPDAPADGGTHGGTHGGADPHATAEWAMPFAEPSHAPEARSAPPADHAAQGHWTVPAAGDDPVDESGEFVLHGRPGGQSAQHVDPHDPAAAYAVQQPPAAPGAHDAGAAPDAYAMADGTPAHPAAEPGDGLPGRPDAQGAEQQPAAPLGADIHTDPRPAGDGPSGASGTYVLSDGTGPQGVGPGGHPGPHAPEQWTPHGGSAHAWQQPAAAAPDGAAAAGGPSGQWSIPVVPDEPADESGEYALSSLSGGVPGPSEAPDPAPATDSVSPSGSSSQDATGVTGTGDHQTAAWTPPAEHAEPTAAAQPARPEQPAPSAQSAQEEAAPDESPAGAPAEPAADSAPPADQLPEPAHPADPHTPPPADPHTEHPCASYVLRVNGTDRPVTDAWIGESLLYVLRERLGLAGAKDGCSQGECGACSVQVDGRLVASCLVPAATAAGAEVRTVEGLAVDGRSSDVQRALAECGAVQCGFCVPGMAMTMHDLLEGNHAPSELETRQAICGNLCRCSGYRGVLDAVRQVVDERAATAAAQEEAQPETEQARIPHQAGPHGGGTGKASA